jgi:hypothetical protein
MKFNRFYVLIFSAALFSYGLFISQVNIKIISDELERSHPEGFYDYSGVINVHSSRSSGSGSVNEIIEQAQAAELDFISITDLNLFEQEPEDHQYHDKLLVMYDGQYSYLNSRLLYLGAKNKLALSGPSRSQAHLSNRLDLNSSTETDGFLILSHPFKKGYSWKGEFPRGLHGIEILNLRQIWQDVWLNDTLSFLWTVILYPFNQNLAFIRLFEIPNREFQLWDELTSQRKTVGLAGSAAKSKIRILGQDIGLPRYKTLFGIVRNHVLLRSELTGEKKSDYKKIISALRAGHFYMSLDVLANPKGFIAKIVDDTPNPHIMGSEVRLTKNQELVVVLPSEPLVPFETVIYKDGKKVMASNSTETRLRLHEPGVYRAVIRVIPTFPLPDGKKWIPWIFTNPFYVK